MVRLNDAHRKCLIDHARRETAFRPTEPLRLLADELAAVMAERDAARELAGPATPDRVYSYSFAVWPDETSPRWNRAVFDLFRLMCTRVGGWDMTEREFDDFREDLAKCGLTLREIERVPYHLPEGVL